LNDFYHFSVRAFKTFSFCSINFYRRKVCLKTRTLTSSTFKNRFTSSQNSFSCKSSYWMAVMHNRAFLSFFSLTESLVTSLQKASFWKNTQLKVKKLQNPEHMHEKKMLIFLLRCLKISLFSECKTTSNMKFEHFSSSHTPKHQEIKNIMCKASQRTSYCAIYHGIALDLFSFISARREGKKKKKNNKIHWEFNCLAKKFKINS
jgi:hypothetical protein